MARVFLVAGGAVCLAFGLGALLGVRLSGGAADAYAKEIVQADFAKPGDSDVLERVMKDLAAKGVPASEPVVRREMDRLLAVAKEQIMKQT